MLPVDLQSEADHWLMYATPIVNVNYLYRFNVSPVDEYLSTHEKVQLSIVIIYKQASSPNYLDWV